ncbi:G6PE-like protein [Mya arenaria]|uniref:G6PE-like protein n=2 Tax=Mya arenaria TaxID=6604 RepID=A0ABY7DZM3_MYAAR|nr:GDH/6PGL endoplasmic bifunctional protein-like isoform X2 [Mya arenaria]XP_052802754.1 GDH/6PGL endoplasmic bifunctional protein-like isoform X2 [Mya arenaria]XP_052802755.1 GDH/6PGL endoplasmic bifunctional protein-like isoform X2 [Mya arenaria]WAR03153.1 G6PE-like protein [Mya arenaria]
MKFAIAAGLHVCLFLVCFAKHQHTNIVIVGGIGDLAKKYLWHSALQLYAKSYNENNTISFYAGARVIEDEGNVVLNKILDRILCDTDDKHCHKLRPKFIRNSHYVMLKKGYHYETLCKKLSSEYENGLTSVRQIFYFSIPSSAYQSVAEFVNEHCRHENVTSTEIVLEKPFGLDKSSAKLQVDTINSYFSGSEVKRVDHYLAKSVTKQILKFRFSNRDRLERLLNNKFVDRVEIVMKERIGVKGRIDFYDQTGVVRDVMQNHLSELLALVAMEMPNNVSSSSHIEKNKLQFLKQIRPVSSNAILTGQYSKYLEEAGEEIENTSLSYLTPTFAASLLQVENPRWQGVPFVLMSGKHMDERSSYVRILFREHEFCVTGCEGSNSTFNKYPRQLVFQIGHGSVPSAGILVSRSLLSPVWPEGVRELPITSKDSNIHGQSPGDFYYAVPVHDAPAYVTVLHDLYHGVKETFVTSERVMALWDIWDNVISRSSPTLPSVYKEYEPGNLNFTVENGHLEFIEKVKIINFDHREIASHATIPNSFRNSTLHCLSSPKLVSSLAQNMLTSAEAAVKERGVFHIAFSGGRTPIILFKELVLNFPYFPWEYSHIWQVDERCVPHINPASNFHTLHEHLIKYTRIPYYNIHPMQVDFAGKLCSPASKGDQLYEESINYLIPDQVIDFVLLGVGNDGHTASLFPHSASLKNTKDLVAYTKSKSNEQMDRMSLLLSVINNARNIAIVVIGKDKHDIVHKLSTSLLNNSLYPITYVSANKGNTSWFIDMDAWLGYTL